MLEQYEYIVIQKAHYVNQIRKSETRNTSTGRLYNINDIMAQELLSVTDILITDYSSCFFDYLICNKPIIHFLYDYEYYRDKDRGLYFSAEDVIAGAIAYTEKELIHEIERAIKHPSDNNMLRSRCKERYMQYESENSSQLIIEYLLKMIG